MNFSPPPATIEELQHRIDLIAGLTLGDLAGELNVVVPENLQVEKGWPGQLLEAYLGASAGNLPEPDFQLLGVELKTLPINRDGKPLETTFVSVAPLTQSSPITWRESSIYKKLRHVLWVPIIAERNIPVPLRQIATPFLWQMDAQHESLLKNDWEELMELITFGHHDKISALHGEALQLRPKAADSSVRTQAFNQQGQPIQAPPKGFYLRTSFTKQILTKQFQL
ncbi:MAG: DNA mismatch repair protein MutH [Psychrosphaera sp.]|jgi:DNA mismatch repair protein MutH|uniref:DNA mismatch repair endonuclease MutH n=1 Tax=Psychrosphaera sp. F3M07 TaxID=2841560 RepID=UPI001C0A4009|nr:DNA mismatch repair endonuclease MutH [Psychrosphaera sp. F3M07]MBU2917132.1 DNA mismatch repair endonuclease MutH [Psychrosphaera sp. F3M07]